MASKQQVIELHQKNPALTSKQIASFILGDQADDYQRLVSTDGWVRRTAQRNGIELGKYQPKPRAPRVPRRDGIEALGRACREAGLTLADIRDIAKTIDEGAI